MSRVDDLGERIERPRVHLARLGHHDGRTVALGECSCQTLNLCSAVIVGGYNLEHVGAEAEQPQGTIDGHVTLRTDDHSDLRGAPQSLPGEIPSGSSKHLVSGGGEAGHVRHLTAGHESNRRLGRQAEEIFEPPGGYVLDNGGRRAGDIGERVLVPCGGEPIGSQRSRNGAAGDDPK